MNNDERNGIPPDDLLTKVFRAIQEEEAGTHVVRPDRMHELILCGDVMKHLFEGIGEVNVLPHDQLPSCGSIRIRANSPFTIEDTELFTKAASLSDNYEIYPRLDGTIMIEFAFYGLTEVDRG